jgi:hypothetical protein
MANRKIYNQAGIAVSSDSSGYCFLDFSGNRTNSIYSNINGLTGYSYNLVKPLTRIVDVSYGFSESRIDVKNMGNFGTIARPSIVSTPITLRFSYYLMGLINEARLGFIFAQPSGNNVNNPSIYDNICPISGFLDRTYQPDYNDSFINYAGANEYWNNTHRDCKNFFVITKIGESDLKSSPSITQTLNNTTGTILKDNIYVYEFGNCYLNSYKASASVGNFPVASVDYTCYNVMYISGGSGQNIPAVNPKDFTLLSGITYNLPPMSSGELSTILLPGDITLNIMETGNNQITNLPISFSDIKVQNFDIDINLNREPLYNLGYRLPMDNIVNYPAYANLSLSAIVGNTSTGSFIDFINKDTEYDISVNMKYSRNSNITGTAILYRFLSAKFNNIQISESISNKKMVSFNVSNEMNPTTNSKGFFISGQLGVPNNNKPLY